jgi:heme exporter protein C
MTAGQRLVPILLVISTVMLAASPYVIDAAPYESTMGLVQRIFYFHVPNAILMLVASTTCGVASVLYLIRRRRTSDHVALAAAEVAVVLGTITLLTGPLWARKAWGVWWDWEPRLTSTLIMWMIFSAYLLLRRFGGPGSEVLSAAVGLFGAVLTPFVYWSVDMLKSLHPKTTVMATLPRPLAVPMIWCLIAFVCFWFAVLILRVRLESTRAKLEQAYLLLED